MVFRNTTEDRTQQVVISAAPKGYDGPLRRRTERLSSFRYVGMIESDYPFLDHVTAHGAMSDDLLFKRTGVDVRRMLVDSPT